MDDRKVTLTLTLSGMEEKCLLKCAKGKYEAWGEEYQVFIMLLHRGLLKHSSPEPPPGKICFELTDIGRMAIRDKLFWENDEVQFARLLAEIQAVGLTDEQMYSLEQSMGLEATLILEIMDRAEEAFERKKEQLV